MKIRVETLSNWMIVITGAAVTLLVTSRFIAEHRQQSTPSPQQYLVGEKVAAEFPVDISKSPQTLLLVLNSRCHYCTESVPLYHDLINAHVSHGRLTRMVAVGLETAPVLHDYLKQHDLEFDDVVSVPPSKIKFRGTPTLLLIDRSGTVTGVWNGFVSTQQKRSELVKLIANGPA